MSVYKQLLKQLAVAISFIVASFVICYLVFAPYYFYVPYSILSDGMRIYPMIYPTHIEYLASLSPLEHFERFLLYTRDFLTFDFVHLGYPDMVPNVIEQILDAMLLTWIQLIITAVFFANFAFTWIGAKLIFRDVNTSGSSSIVVKRVVTFGLVVMLVGSWLWYFCYELSPRYFGLIAWNTENPLNEYGAEVFNEPLFRLSLLAIILAFILLIGVYFLTQNKRMESRRVFPKDIESSISDALSSTRVRIVTFTGLLISSLIFLDYIFLGHGIGNLFLRSLRLWGFVMTNIIILYLCILAILASVTLEIAYGLVKFGPFDFHFLKNRFRRVLPEDLELVSEGAVAP